MRVRYNACVGKHRPKKKTRRDIADVARSIVEQATGEKLSGGPLPKHTEEPAEPDTRNQAAVELSKLGASKGGKARAKKLSASKRKAIAKRAARARWRNKSQG